jgi:hypothetical protein
MTVRSGVNPTAIQEFEARHGVKMPADLREYFLLVDGMEDELDPGMNRFWPLAMIKRVSDELTDTHSDRWAYPDCFLFADHCIWCSGWAVRLGAESLNVSDAVFLVTAGNIPGEIIAPSFTAFVKMYLEDQYFIFKT